MENTNNRLYEKIIQAVSKEVKRILNEEIYDFDVQDYAEDENTLVDHNTIDSIVYYPFTIYERIKYTPYSIDYIKERILNAYPSFNNDDIIINDVEREKCGILSKYRILIWTVNNKNQLKDLIKSIYKESGSKANLYRYMFVSILQKDVQLPFSDVNSIEYYLRQNGLNTEINKFVKAVEKENLTLKDCY